MLNKTLERTLLFLQEASGVPVMLSMLVLVFEEREEAVRRGQQARLPSSRLELYVQATRAAVAKLYPTDAAKQELTLRMLQRVAVANMLVERREFDSGEVAEALGAQAEEHALWRELERQQALPLVKVLAEGSDDGAQGQFQFKHLSFAEAMFVQFLIDHTAEWGGWRDDGRAVKFLMNPFYENTCRIGAGASGVGEGGGRGRRCGCPRAHMRYACDALTPTVARNNAQRGWARRWRRRAMRWR